MASDTLFKLDQQQAIGSPTAVKCPVDPAHGNMVARIDAQTFLCSCGAQSPATLRTES